MPSPPLFSCSSPLFRDYPEIVRQAVILARLSRSARPASATPHCQTGYNPTHGNRASNTLDNVTHKIVSDEAESLILVDRDDNVRGHLPKAQCHDGEGVLHRAFSLFIFNPAGELLLQQRAPQKRLWPNFWSNSCCSHPRQGETLDVAVQRRCEEELGFRTPLKFVYKFEYSAKYLDLGSERELCSVFVGSFDGAPTVNATEIKAIRWISPAELDTALVEKPETFTPWFLMEWRALREEYPHELPL